MYVKEVFSIWRLLKGIWVGVVAVTAYATLVFYLFSYQNWHFLSFPISITTILGTALSLLLGFRTNSAYDRWWEARKSWGEIVNDSRTLVRQAVTFTEAPAKEKDELVSNIAHLQIAWCYALANSLRRTQVLVYADLHLTAEEREYVSAQDNIPNGILNLIQFKVATLHDSGKIKTLLYQNIDDTLRRLCDAMGKCERIKNTVFPTQYAFFVHLVIFIFTLVLPMGLVESIGRIAIPITFTISFLFFYVEWIAYIMQNPFENGPNDIPMTSMSRNIEINLLQLIGAEKIPEKILPKNGVVM
ncbi:putative membrane protein [Dyadobacter sp. BE34]|uniref:Membrane protein n=1 Tax=Dyadobacter fermentans TaxID=94254 RepID=A0ABU1R729_9BACT|nr:MULTISPECIES: bestrophin family ion channel [Dyadobacter]MDR6809206.1 putative membrane protein [Dyadobacter fermentans]MDR7046949.1 putative membrane protein [Dyadobacter sp. BE242]MDR7201263.1 putative membrane protein [Dyadobacter sp. BE34]MDR7219223.1 putative membrane protein [Dyadobacter sp. BE31]MDR7264567.1 putative membrane protein [Dyadobacter sp. BE32]